MTIAMIIALMLGSIVLVALLGIVGHTFWLKRKHRGIP